MVSSAAKPRSTPPQPASGKAARGQAGGVLGISIRWQLTGLAALILALAAALIFSGAAAARGVSDPGALVRWGLPVAKAVHNISLATVIG